MDVLFDEMARYFALLSEPTRLKILYALCPGELRVNDIVALVPSTQANVSRQINRLHKAGILARRKDGTQVFYRIADEHTITLCKNVCGRIAAALGQPAPGAA